MTHTKSESPSYLPGADEGQHLPRSRKSSNSTTEILSAHFWRPPSSWLLLAEGGRSLPGVEDHPGEAGRDGVPGAEPEGALRPGHCSSTEGKVNMGSRWLCPIARRRNSPGGAGGAIGLWHRWGRRPLDGAAVRMPGLVWGRADLGACQENGHKTSHRVYRQGLTYPGGARTASIGSPCRDHAGFPCATLRTTL